MLSTKKQFITKYFLSNKLVIFNFIYVLCCTEGNDVWLGMYIRLKYLNILQNRRPVHL